MDTAEFKTMRETLGLTAQNVADELDVSHRTAQRWEQYGKVNPPPFAVEWITNRWNEYLDKVAIIVEELQDMQERYENKPNFVSLSRYVSDASARAAGEMGMTATQHAALLGLIRFNLNLLGYDCKINWRPVEN